MRIVLAVVLGVLALGSAAEAKQRALKPPVVTDDSFEKYIKFSTDKRKAIDTEFSVRGWIDRTDHSRLYQVVITSRYRGNWRNYQRASDNTAREFEAVAIGHYVGTCPSMLGCELIETVGIDLDEQYLTSHLDGMKFKFWTEAGQWLLIEIPPDMIQSALDVTAKYPVTP